MGNICQSKNPEQLVSLTEVVPIVRTVESGFLAYLFPYQAALFCDQLLFLRIEGVKIFGAKPIFSCITSAPLLSNFSYFSSF
jgi:hypothetical protein